MQKHYEESPPFEAGDRIELDSMPDDPCPIALGTQGTVRSCTYLPKPNAFWQVSVEWDNCRALLLCVPPDRARKI